MGLIHGPLGYEINDMRLKSICEPSGHQFESSQQHSTIMIVYISIKYIQMVSIYFINEDI